MPLKPIHSNVAADNTTLYGLADDDLFDDVPPVVRATSPAQDAVGVAARPTIATANGATIIPIHAGSPRSCRK